MISPAKAIVAYLRVSSDKQDASRQRHAIEAWAKQHDVLIAEWFVDAEGRNPRDKASKRKHFQRLLAAVENGSVDAIVVDSQDRFGTRDAFEFGKYIDHLRQYGVELWSASQGCLSADDDATILGATVSALTSAREQREKGLRSLEGKILKAKAGEYQGGYPAYGFDVVCFDQQGHEKWRVVYTGHFERTKIAGKRREEFNGKNNSPAKDPTDILRIRPSIEADRLKVVKQIFGWYADETISPTQIATRLNTMGVSAVFGPAWNKQKIKELLANPVYIGHPTWNKKGGSRFVEYLNGQTQRVEPKKGRIVAGRRRKPADYVQADKPQFRPIIPPQLFERVQRKLELSSKEHSRPNRKPPRTAKLWLRGLLICYKCGQPMRATASTTQRNIPSYLCATYGTYGRQNPTGCRCHRVRAALIEPIVERYLDEAYAKIAGLMRATESHQLDAYSPQEATYKAKRAEMLDLIDRMSDRVSSYSQQVGGKKMMKQFEAWGQECAKAGYPAERQPGTPLQNLFVFVFDKQAPAIEAKLAELDAEHSQLVDNVLDLPKSAKQARDKANKRILVLEAEMEALRGELVQLADGFADIMAELTARQNAIEAAKRAVSNEAGYRRKAELVRRVIDRIVCHFAYADRPAANEPKSYLSKVEIFPTEGDPACFPVGNKPGPG